MGSETRKACDFWRPCCCHLAQREKEAGEPQHCWGCCRPQAEHEDGEHRRAARKEVDDGE